MAGLTPDQIQTLMATSRTKGLYLSRLTDFINSGEGGVAVSEQWPADFGPDKKVATVKQGFENAKNSKNAPATAKDVRVVLNEDVVYLLNPVAAGLAPAQATEEATA